MALLPRILDAVGDRNIPVVAAGSIVDARGYVAALSMGAKGICVGTRLVYFTTNLLFLFKSSLRACLFVLRWIRIEYIGSHGKMNSLFQRIIKKMRGKKHEENIR